MLNVERLARNEMAHLIYQSTEYLVYELVGRTCIYKQISGDIFWYPVLAADERLTVINYLLSEVP